MNGRILGIVLGVAVLGIAFAGGVSAAEDLTENPEDYKCPPHYATCDLGDVISGADAPITADGPITAEGPITADGPITGPITASTPVGSLEVNPLVGCCCCEWRFKPALDVMSEIRAY